MWSDSLTSSNKKVPTTIKLFLLLLLLLLRLSRSLHRA
jgi:hypothetical protein